MIDLSKNQIVEQVIKCWFYDSDGKLQQGELWSIDHRLRVCPFTVTVTGDFKATYSVKEIFLEDPTQPKQELMTREQILGFLANKTGILVRCENNYWQLPNTFSYIQPLEDYDWVKVDINGNFLTEPSKFWRTK